MNRDNFRMDQNLSQLFASAARHAPTKEAITASPLQALLDCGLHFELHNLLSYLFSRLSELTRSL